jgi:hypothetical protein
VLQRMLPLSITARASTGRRVLVGPWERDRPKGRSMMRKTLITSFVLAAVGLIEPTVASARGGGGGGHGGGFGGGGFRGGGFHGGFGGGGFRGGGFRGRGFGGYGFGLYYGGYYPYAYNDYYDDGGCYLVRRRVMTPYGWRIRPVQVCG